MRISVRQVTGAAGCGLVLGMAVFVLRLLDNSKFADTGNSVRIHDVEVQPAGDDCCDFESYVNTTSSKLSSAIRRWLAGEAAATAEAAQLHSDEMLYLVSQLWGEIDPKAAISWIQAHCVDSWKAGRAYWAVSEGFVRKDALAAIEMKFSEPWGKHLSINDELLQDSHRHHRPEEVEALLVRIPESHGLLKPVLFAYARDLLKSEGSEAALEFIENRKDRNLRVAASFSFTQNYAFDDTYEAVLDWYSRQTDPNMDFAKEKIAERIATGLLAKGIDLSELSASTGESIISAGLQRAWDASVAFEAGDSATFGRWLSRLDGYPEAKLLVNQAREALEDATVARRLDFALSMCDGNRDRFDSLGKWNYLDAVVTSALQDDPKATLVWAEGGHAKNLPKSPASMVAKHWIEFDEVSEDPGNWAVASLEGEQQDGALSVIVSAMMRVDPAAAIAWIDSIGDLDVRAFALGEAAANWWLVDADAANVWIDAISLDKDRDVALAGAVKYARYGHPETDTALGIISRIGNTSIRRKALLTLFRRNSYDARALAAQERLASNAISPIDREWITSKYAEQEKEALEIIRR